VYVYIATTTTTTNNNNNMVVVIVGYNMSKLSRQFLAKMKWSHFVLGKRVVQIFNIARMAAAESYHFSY